jgi:putative protein-disulfide isomerase
MYSYFKSVFKRLLLAGIYFLNFTIMTAFAQTETSEDILYYVYDPLCGWCYGFSPVMNQVQETIQDRCPVEVISGGMVVDERVGPLSQIAPYIRDGVKRVEELTGVKFGNSYLEDLWGEGTRIMNSWPACLALTVFKSINTQHGLQYASDLQKAIYFEGIHPEDMNYFAGLAANYGVDKNEFLKRCNEDTFKLRTRQEFQFANDLKATGYPYVVLRKGGAYFLVAHGYTDLDTILGRLGNIWKEE